MSEKSMKQENMNINSTNQLKTKHENELYLGQEETNGAYALDYNNEGVDVIMLSKRDSDNCILVNIKNMIQKSPNLKVATMESEKIGNCTENIIEAGNIASIQREKQTLTPKYIDAASIKSDIRSASRTMDDKIFKEIDSQYINLEDDNMER